jgi:hypothetical protein
MFVYILGRLWPRRTSLLFHCALDTSRFEDECGTETFAFPNLTDHLEGLHGATVGGQVVHLVRINFSGALRVAIHVPFLRPFRTGRAIVGKGDGVEFADGAHFT